MLRIFGVIDDIINANIEKVTTCEHCGQTLREENAGHGRVQEGIEEEFGCYDVDIIFSIGEPDSGALVEMTYNGLWSARVQQLGEDISIPWPVNIEAESGYSVVVKVDCPNGTKVRWSTRERP